MRDLPDHDIAATQPRSAALREAAEPVDDLAGRLDHRADAVRFEGPAALRRRAAMAERKLRTVAIARELRALSHSDPDRC
ncbi:MAG: hypothetical protein QOE86_1826 [Solirubrobacteraceae bacterium]|jgi:hypothetical protein|nr:hypothetical protein [Solirubrobacteraceae bacterium]